jgi:hypothetical protein
MCIIPATAIGQIVAVFYGVREVLGWHWIVAALVAISGALPVIGTILGILGAMKVWGWSFWQAGVLFGWQWAMFGILIVFAKIFEGRSHNR